MQKNKNQILYLKALETISTSKSSCSSTMQAMAVQIIINTLFSMKPKSIKSFGMQNIRSKISCVMLDPIANLLLSMIAAEQPTKKRKNKLKKNLNESRQMKINSRFITKIISCHLKLKKRRKKKISRLFM